MKSMGKRILILQHFAGFSLWSKKCTSSFILFVFLQITDFLNKHLPLCELTTNRITNVSSSCLQGSVDASRDAVVFAAGSVSAGQYLGYRRWSASGEDVESPNEPSARGVPVFQRYSGGDALRGRIRSASLSS